MRRFIILLLIINATPVYAGQTTQRVLTLRDAIELALRYNPAVKDAQAQRIVDKFALSVAAASFQPQFTDQLSYQENVVTHQWNVSGGVTSTLATAFGTRFSAGILNTTGGVLSMTQPLLQGGWFVPQLNYLTAVDNEKISELAFAQNIMDTIKQVIAQYTSLVQAIHDVDLQKEQLRQTKRELSQDFLRLHAGKMARSDYLQETIQYEQDQLNGVIQRNTLRSTYQSFLLALGLVGAAAIHVNPNMNIIGFSVLDQNKCVALALQHNVSYLEDKLTLENDERALKYAKNQLWPQFNVIGSTAFNRGQLPNSTVGVSISIPIDPIDVRESILNARVALEKQNIQLAQDRQQIMSAVMSDWESVHADLEQIALSKKTILMQMQTVKDNALLLRYGQVTRYDYLQIRNQLLSQQLSLVSNQMNLINDVSALDDVMGTLLQRWSIQLRD